MLSVTQLCIVSNNSYTNIGTVWDITKYIRIIFYKYLHINILPNNRLYNQMPVLLRMTENCF
ncbi:hypothetical protein F2Y87_03810 [Bacteroides cellulosilyticus]|uniref:Uncharacterized protein n=1 Tax=Bacteroides cellulosilyticus TaxID=246787 RepID=A0A6L3K6G7_9BACE|nr:hypothetical protein F2Y87_03810 [Bacteroides cellulosilyticus]